MVIIHGHYFKRKFTFGREATFFEKTSNSLSALIVSAFVEVVGSFLIRPEIYFCNDPFVVLC